MTQSYGVVLFGTPCSPIFFFCKKPELFRCCYSWDVKLLLGLLQKVDELLNTV